MLVSSEMKNNIPGQSLNSRVGALALDHGQSRIFRTEEGARMIGEGLPYRFMHYIALAQGPTH